MRSAQAHAQHTRWVCLTGLLLRAFTMSHAWPMGLMLQVSIHAFNGTAVDRDFNRSLLITTLGVGQQWRSGFVIPGWVQEGRAAHRATTQAIHIYLSAHARWCMHAMRLVTCNPCTYLNTNAQMGAYVF